MKNESQNQKKNFLLTMGDPAGIGPEIAVKALCGKLRERPYRVVVVGDAGVMRKAAGIRGLSPSFKIINDLDALNGLGISDDANNDNPYREGMIPSNNSYQNSMIPSDNSHQNSIISSDNSYQIGMIPPDNSYQNSIIYILDTGEPAAGRFTPGIPQATCGRASYNYIVKAIELTMEKKAAGVVTGPISKESLKLAGINYPGHTEIFADKTGAADYSMVFLLDGVAVAHVTTHVPLRRAIDMITRDRVLRQIRLLHRSLKSLGLDPPRMAAAGLNPHAGENGLFGDEEIREIIPAVEDARREGINIAGPLPPDTVFNRAFKGEFNGVVSMLHDHGFVALKSRDFDRGVNITVGLPIIRTSVGHGTAFDKAWKGEASEASLIAAVEAAASMPCP